MGVGGARAAAGRGRRGVPALNAGVARGASTEKSVYLSRCPRALRDGADFIITNPPFSLFRERDGVKVNRVPGVCWFTNLEHGRRYEPLGLMTTADNLRFSRHREIRGRAAYPRYDNYDAIEVPYADASPSDYDGVMGVPIIFLDRYCPEQFEILGSNRGIGQDADGVYGRSAYVDGVEVFKRLFIRRRS